MPGLSHAETGDRDHHGVGIRGIEGVASSLDARRNFCRFWQRSDVIGSSDHLVAATGFEPRAHGCYLRQIVRSHEPGWIPVRRHVLFTTVTLSLSDRCAPEISTVFQHCSRERLGLYTIASALPYESPTLGGYRGCTLE